MTGFEFTCLQPSRRIVSLCKAIDKTTGGKRAVASRYPRFWRPRPGSRRQRLLRHKGRSTYATVPTGTCCFCLVCIYTVNWTVSSLRNESLVISPRSVT
ncbi:hypothetical protein L209DRAFT_756405 [Thermothelomyces heterothallicus CBS 203.75]